MAAYGHTCPRGGNLPTHSTCLVIVGRCRRCVIEGLAIASTLSCQLSSMCLLCLLLLTFLSQEKGNEMQCCHFKKWNTRVSSVQTHQSEKTSSGSTFFDGTWHFFMIMFQASDVFCVCFNSFFSSSSSHSNPLTRKVCKFLGFTSVDQMLSGCEFVFVCVL